MAETTCKFHPDRTDVFYTYPLPSKLAHAFEGWSLCVVKRMMLTQLRNLNNFEEKTWPLFLTMLSLNE
jgi:hypothetical protein